ncbi:transmembrane protein, putative (macronuclear) [Tetrahymena thermophila SB210]|uniref:Transmembrane protein, putative n=1 Tax=Tetrahymena thermophila (strain SB210) TaxID=312017 RepID=Q245Y1_TETTS|nr:transmembrane protein, putative [Tetrahymena thermophila SB210]EAS03502.2 transmembrane protein, putative [Tetrahymena thermophila SB210]|eukprot:XP_001023747.2 transmembrane protein, putative [Tetrahymena thermophila SB210]
MKLVNSEYQIFNQDDTSQTIDNLRQFYSLERTICFEKMFVDEPTHYKLFKAIDFLLRIAIIIYVSVNQLEDPISLGLGIVAAIQTGLNIAINYYYYQAYQQTMFLGQNSFTKTILNIVSSLIQVDWVLFTNQCKFNQKGQHDVTNYDYSTVQWVYIKRLAIAARIHLITYCFFYFSSSINNFSYVVFSLSFVLMIYYNHLNSNKFISSSLQSQQPKLDQIITNIELIIQFLQSLLFTIYIGAASLAWVAVFLPSTTVLFSFLSFIDSRFKFEPFTIGVIEYIFLGSNTCHLMPILKNDFSMAQIHISGVLKLFFLSIFCIAQASIQGLIISQGRDKMPEGAFELQVALVSIINPIMLIKSTKVVMHFFQQITIQTNSFKDISPNQFKNQPKQVVYYQNNKILSPEDLNVFEQLINKDVREYYIFINNSFCIQTYHRHAQITVSSMKDPKDNENLNIICLSLLNKAKSLTIKLNMNPLSHQHKDIDRFFIFLLKNMMNPSESIISFDQTLLINFIIEGNKTKKLINIDEIFNYPKKSILEFIVFEKYQMPFLLNNHHQIYYDLFEEM